MASFQVATRDEVQPGKMKAVEANGAHVLVVNSGGNLYAISGVCPHAGGDLSQGKLEDFVVKCPRHGSSYDVRTGACVSPPKIGPLKLKPTDTKTYAVRIEGETIVVEVGEGIT